VEKLLKGFMNNKTILDFFDGIDDFLDDIDDLDDEDYILMEEFDNKE
jgi:hypothetical protein